MRLALYQPDIAQNTGTLLRLGSCLGVPLDIIGPCGFAFSASALRRAGLDYIDPAGYSHHASWEAFLGAPERSQGRLVLLTTQARLAYTAFGFEPGDTLLLGRESAGVPAPVHDRADARLLVPMVEGKRSLNVAVCGAMVLAEGLRQTGGFPQTTCDSGAPHP